MRPLSFHFSSLSITYPQFTASLQPVHTMSRSPKSAALRSNQSQFAAKSASDAAWFGRLAPGMLIVLTFVMCCFPLRDFDFWWHLRTGELILERGTVPFADWYTYTDHDQLWIDMHWGFQVLIVGIYRSLGINGVILIKAALYTAAVMVGWMTAGLLLSRSRKVLIWLPAVVAITGRAYERPEMLTVVFLAIALFLAEKCRTQPKWIWAWPGLILVWANCHALFILGIVVWCAVAGEAILGRLTFFSQRPFARQWHTLPISHVVSCSVLIVIAAMITPYGFDGLMFPWVLYRKFSTENDFYSVRIGEFKAPIMFLLELIRAHGLLGGLILAAKNLYFSAEIIVFLVGSASFIAVFRTRQFRLSRLLLFIGFSHLAWVATRNTSVFSLVSAVIASANFEDRDRVAHPAATGRFNEVPLWNQMTTLGLGLLMVLFISGEWGHFVEKWKVFGLGEARHWFGHDAAKFCQRNGMPQRAFVAHIGLAGTWIYHNGPAKKVFMDPRLEVCTRATFEKYDQVMALMVQGQTEWEQIINPDQGEMPVVVLDNRYSRLQIFAMLQSSAWRLVFADPAAAVFLSAEQAEALMLPPANPVVLTEILD